jgi:lysozyme family protein
MLRKFLYNNFKIEFPTSQPLKSAPAEKSPQSEQQKRECLFYSMQINTNIVDLKGRILVPNIPYKATEIARKIIDNKQRYLNIAHKFANPIKWFHIALLHRMESGGDFTTYLGNGQPLNKKTTIVPKGRGPFSSFESGAIDAIRYKKLDRVEDWSIGNTLYILEGFNGYGYEDYRGIHSPYLWSGSNHYTAGLYIADSVYSKTAVSQQIGIALILKKLIELDNIQI